MEEPIHSPIALGLSEPQMREVAEVVLNWAAVDTFMGYCLNFALARSARPPALSARVPDLDISEKHKALREACKSVGLSTTESGLLTELNRAYGAWGGDRNMVAHGLATRAAGGDETMLHSERKGKAVLVSDLPLFVRRSRYALHVVVRLNMLFAGIAWDPLGPLPPRPN